MPLPMVHLAIAKNLYNAGFKVNSPPQFFLGAISPDAIHMRPNTDHADKRKTHLSSNINWIDMDEAEYQKHIADFVDENSNKANLDFLRGYGIHILTDMYWSKQVCDRFAEDYRNDPSPIQEERWAYYNDTDIMDFMLFQECGWRNEVWDKLSAAKGADFLDLLSAQEIDAWNERTLHWYDSGESQHKNPVRYITKPVILSFICNCSTSFFSSF